MAWLTNRFFSPPRPQRVEVNLNAISSDGLVRVRSTHFARPPLVGERVAVFEPTDEVEGTATVARISDRTGLVYLDVAWEALHDLVPVATEATPEKLGIASNSTLTVQTMTIRMAR